MASEANLDERIVQAVERFRAAPFDNCWELALEGLAAACGASSAQVIGVGSDVTVPFNRMINASPEGLAEFIAINGGDPARNPRVRFGLKAPILQTLSEAEFGRLDEILKLPFYADFLCRYQIPFTLQTTVARGGPGVIGSAVLYSGKHGLPGLVERAAFEAITPTIQEAVRLQLALEGYGARVLSGSLESVGIACFICDANGGLAALTSAAEALLRAQTHFRVERGRLQALHPDDSAVFSAALRRSVVRTPRLRPAAEFGLRAAADGALLVCHVAPLPYPQFGFGFEACTMVIVRTPRDRGKLAPILQAAYGLTLAEAGVALDVAGGGSLAEIARERGVSLETVRSQLKSAAGKLGVSRQSEIASKLGQL